MSQNVTIHVKKGGEEIFALDLSVQDEEVLCWDPGREALITVSKQRFEELEEFVIIRNSADRAKGMA